MRSYLPAFAKTARVHRYCAALNGRNQERRLGGITVLPFFFALCPADGRGAMCVAVPASTVGLGHSTLSIPHLVRSGKSSSVVRR